MNKLKIVKVLKGLPLIASFLILFSFSIASASKWIKTYGGTNSDSANSIQQTSDGGYIVAGQTWSFGAGNQDVWVLKLDGYGIVQWQKTYGDAGDDVASSIQQTSDDGYIVTGSTESIGADGYDAWILKLDGDGNIEWQKAFSETHLIGYSVHQTSDGGYIVAGTSRTSGTYVSDAWVLKLDGNGNMQWQKTYGGTNSDSAKSIQQTSDGGYIIAAWTVSFGAGESDAWVLKLDDSGNVVWQKTYGGTNGDSASSIQQTSDGGYIVAGYTISFGIGSIWVLKLDGGGIVQWQKTYGGSSIDYPYYIQQTSDGGYIVTGGTTGAGNAWVLKIDGSGIVQWQKTYGGTNGDGASSIQQTSDGGYIVAGRTRSFGVGDDDVWVLRVDGSGNINGVCSIVKTSDIQVTDTNATVQDTDVTGTDCYASPQTTAASVSDTNAVMREQCIYGCNLIPDATSIPRGGTLGFQGTVTNYTNNTGSVLFGMKVTLPNGNWYPASGYLIEPFSILLNPSQSKSGHRSHAIPVNAPVGIYEYHGYVGNYGVGIYDECRFTFEVREPCVSNLDCGEVEFCQKPVGQCEGEGVCTRKGEICFLFVDPVCGCDGVTYSNLSCAYMAGASVAYFGTCIP